MSMLTKKRSYRIKEISNSLHKRLKILSAEKEITIQQAILEAIEQYVSMGEGQERREQNNEKVQNTRGV